MTLSMIAEGTVLLIIFLVCLRYFWRFTRQSLGLDKSAKRCGGCSCSGEVKPCEELPPGNLGQPLEGQKISRKDAK